MPPKNTLETHSPYKKRSKRSIISIVCVAVFLILAAIGSVLPDPNFTYAQLGEPLDFFDWQVTVESFEVVDYIPASIGGYRPDEDSVYVIANLTIKNIGTTAHQFRGQLFPSKNDMVCKIFYQEAYQYSPSNMLGLSSDYLGSNTLNPLQSTSGKLVYSVPKDIAYSDELTYVLEQRYKKHVLLING